MRASIIVLLTAGSFAAELTGGMEDYDIAGEAREVIGGAKRVGTR